MLEKIGLPPKPSMRGATWVLDASICQGCAAQFSLFTWKIGKAGGEKWKSQVMLTAASLMRTDLHLVFSLAGSKEAVCKAPPDGYCLLASAF
ncbi:hypothetical protein ACQJBY_027362 [Aegilops geniculata]